MLPFVCFLSLAEVCRTQKNNDWICELAFERAGKKHLKPAGALELCCIAKDKPPGDLHKPAADLSLSLMLAIIEDKVL